MRKYHIIFMLCCLCPLLFTSADKFTFKANKMSGFKATGRDTTILTGNAEVKSDNLLLRAERIEIQGC